MSERIRLDTSRDGVTVLTFDYPAAHNALSLEAMHSFAGAVARMADDSRLRVVILTGAGDKAFCSGGDLEEMLRLGDERAAAAMSALMGDALLALERLPVPVIAAVNGYALGGGAEIAVACDLRLVEDGAKLGFVQAKRGLIPGWGGGQRLLRLVGYARALDLLLRAEALPAAELLALGLANRVVPKGAALAEALAYADHLLTLDPAVVRSMKALLQSGLNQPYVDALRAERSLFAPLWMGDARRASMEAFVKGRGG